jgi:hypothetical protein
VSAGDRVLGRDSGAGDVEELTIGSNLQITSGALNLATNITVAGTLTVTGAPTFNTRSVHAAGAQINTNQTLIYQRGSYTAGSGDWNYPPVIVSTSAASGTAPDGVIWIQVP